MAKIKGVKYWSSIGTRPTDMPIYTRVEKRREENVLSRQFYACAWVSTPKGTGYTRKRSRRIWQVQTCSYGKNPRQAIGRAVAKLGSNLQRRRGVFAEYKK